MKRSLRNPFVALGVAGTIVAGAAGVAGVAMAQEDSSPGSVPGGDTHMVEGMKHRGAGLVGLAIIIQKSGLDRQVFIDGFAAGKTVSQVLEENGVDPATLKADILVGAGEALDTIFNSTPQLPSHDGPGGHRGHQLGGAAETLAGLLGITVDELKEAMKSGDTIADIAEANGVNLQTVIDGLVAEAQGKLDEAVANGRITQDQADKLEAELKDRITTFVNEGRPMKNGSGPSFRGRFPGGRFEFGSSGSMPGGASNPLIG